MLKAAAIKEVKRSFVGYLSQLTIQNEAGGLMKFQPSPTQQPVLKELLSSPIGEGGSWPIICKPRQSHTSTAVAAWVLRESQYTMGTNGLLICNKDDTNRELWDRIRGMYESEPEAIRIPSITESAKELYFDTSKSRIKTITAKGEDPGLGFSIDRLVASEFGFWKNGGKVLGKILPALVKRPKARVVIESTPGVLGGDYHNLWLRSLDGKTNFKPLFICWLDYLSYTKDLDITLDNSEIDFQNRYPKATKGHIAFRRFMLDTVYKGDIDQFEHYYPNDPLSGWLSSSSPALPQTALKALYATAKDDPGYLKATEEPKRGCVYYLFVDPNGYGTSGDPAAYTMWNVTEGREVAYWSERKDPTLLARDLATFGRKYNNATIVIEANSAACITALTTLGYPNIWNDGNKSHPGFYRTGANAERCIVDLIFLLYEKQFPIASKSGLLQLMAWDGTTSNRPSEDGIKHHFDRAITYFMAATILKNKLPKPTPPPLVETGYIPLYKPAVKAESGRL